VEITNVEPKELDTSNNIATKSITVLKAVDDSDSGGSGNSIIDQFQDISPMYRYGILAIIIVIIIIVIFAVVSSVSRSKKKKEMEQQLQIGESGKPGMVVFKPLGSDQEKAKASRSKAPYIVIIFAILSIIMMAVSMYLPWYQEKIDFIPDEEGDIETMLLVQYSFSNIYGKNAFLDIEETFNWDDESFEDLETTRNLYLNAQRIVIAGLAMSVLLLIGAILCIVKKWKKIVVIFGILAFIVCLLGPMLFMMQHPGAFAEDTEADPETDEEGLEFTFYGSSERESSDDGELVESWGPTYGWYLSVLGSVFAFIGFIAALKIPTPDSSGSTGKSKEIDEDKNLKEFRFIDEDLGPAMEPSDQGYVVFESLDDEVPTKSQMAYDSIGIR
jgi:flagellar basal body-associated protein FliL